MSTRAAGKSRRVVRVLIGTRPTLDMTASHTPLGEAER
jgi:hypothetical protein